MLRQTFSVLMAALMVCGDAVSAQTGVSKKPSIKEQVLDIGQGSPVEVRLRNKEKIRGRMGEISDEGFVIQYVKAEKVQSRNISFVEVKSIKPVQDVSKGGHLALAILAGVGLTSLILKNIAAALAGD